jgi:hypothetical protein
LVDVTVCKLAVRQSMAAGGVHETVHGGTTRSGNQDLQAGWPPELRMVPPHGHVFR